MKRLAAVSALMVTGVLAFGASNVSAGAASAPRPSGTACTPGSATGSGAQKISSLGPQWTSVGITVPSGARVTSIVVTTGDDYTGINDLFGRTRVTDNQKQEQGRVWVGGPVNGTPLGGYTLDVPETGAGGDPLKASITTTVFTGNQAASGEVVVWHNNNTTTANSFFISSIRVSWTCGSANGGGGSYPPGPDAPGLSVQAPDANTAFSAEASNLCDEPVTFTLSGTPGQSQTVTPTGGTASVTFNGVPAGDYTVSISQACGKTAFQSLKIENAASGGGGGVGVNPGGGAVVTTTTVVGSQTPVATTTPAATATTVAPTATTAAPQVGSAGVAPTTTALGGGASGTNAALPATGSDSFSVMQVAFFAIAAGLGLVLVASARRRKGASAA